MCLQMPSSIRTSADTHAHALTPETRTACARTSASPHARTSPVVGCLSGERIQRRAGLSAPGEASGRAEAACIFLPARAQAGWAALCESPPRKAGNISIFLLKCVGAQG